MRDAWQAPDGTTAGDIAQDCRRHAAIRAAVKAFLLERGETGATTAELTTRFGGHAVVRLNEIRHDDLVYDYRKEREGVGYRYWLYIPSRQASPPRVTVTPSEEVREGFLF